MSPQRVAVTVLTGFLGAGKSTLLSRWLQELPREEVAVIINERGDVGIDGELLAGRVSRLREITGGCVCCRSQAELVDALQELGQSTPPPRRVLVETSGAASPAGVLQAVCTSSACERFRLDGVITVLDVVRAPEVLAFDLAAEQLGFADVVVLSHVDEARSAVPSVDLSAIRARVLQHAPAAVIVQAERGGAAPSLSELLSKRAESLHLPPSGPSAHASIEAVSMQFEGELDEEHFGDWMEGALGGVEARILRIKGIVAIAGVEARVIVQGVSDSVNVELGAPWESTPRSCRLVVLGLGLDASALQGGFAACAAVSTRSTS